MSSTSESSPRRLRSSRRRGLGARRSSKLFPRRPSLVHLLRASARAAPRLSLSGAVVCLALLCAWPKATESGVLASSRPFIIALLKILMLHVFWVGTLGALTEFQRNLPMTSQLEDQICDLLTEQLDHSFDATSLAGGAEGGFRTVQDALIGLYLSTMSIEQDPWWRFLFTATFKIIAATRIIGLAWRVLEIISQTVWLESAWARDNKISAEQTKIFMETSKNPCFLFFGAFLLNDLCVSFGVTTQPIMYSFLVGAGVLGASSQQVIVDFIASMHLIWGRPFEAGDAIAVKGCSKIMSVKSISYKYTFLQAMDGEEIVMPNHHIANTQIQNFGRCLERRRVFTTLKLSRDLPAADLLKMPDLVRELLRSVDLHDLVREPDEPIPEEADLVNVEGDEVDDDGQDGCYGGNRGGGRGGGSSSSSSGGRGGCGGNKDIRSADVEFFTCWCKSVEPAYYVIEIGYILRQIPDFRSAQHRINIALAAGLESSGKKIYATDAATMLMMPSD